MWSSLQLSHRLYKLKPFILTSKMMWHLECGTDFEVNRNCKKTALFFGKRTKKIRGYSYQDVRWWKPAFLQSAEMRNFSAAKCGKVIKGNLRNVPHLTFLQITPWQLSAFRIPQNTRALFWRHLRDRKLSSPRLVQSASWPVRDMSSPRVGNPRVGVSASCPVTFPGFRQPVKIWSWGQARFLWLVVV